ncbi:GntR family transcriptional regulator [Marivita sp.]|uniref:GntR family transcriptional regulator n=1 Tax=Marivita sp. TaxID=2003365 RepID=UPI003F6B0027
MSDVHFEAASTFPDAAGLAPDKAISLSLSRAIHEHKLSPGIKLGEDELAEIYGVSRTVVRSALRTLAHHRLVEIKRNRGAFIAQPSPREAREVFEARELLEPRTAREAARRATSADAARLRRHIAREHEASLDGDRGLSLYLSGQLHVEIARIAAQDTITGFIETLIARSSLIVALYWRRESAICGHHDHESLVCAIEAHQPDEAEALMRSHLVDLHSALDLERPTSVAGSLKEMLTGP